MIPIKGVRVERRDKETHDCATGEGDEDRASRGQKSSVFDI